MRRILLFSLALFLLTSANCDRKHEETDVFDNRQAVDLSDILDVCKWYQQHEDEADYIDAVNKISPDLPEHECHLFGDTSFVVRLPEYTHSSHPILAYAEEFYNTCCLGWNIWSNFETWYRSHTADTLRSDEEIVKSTGNINVTVIRDENLRKAAQVFKDSMLTLMKTPPGKWAKNEDAMGHLISFVDMAEEKAYRFYDDEDAFAYALDSVLEMAEGLAQERFQRYLDADENVQLEVMLSELNACKTFDEQCALWRNWADCDKSSMEDEWLVAVGGRLMRSGNYCPLLGRIWLTWRALCQGNHFGLSRDSAIPNHYYNEFRKMVYIACLKRIERHPDDIYAIHCAYSTGGRVNLLRYGESDMGNDALMETFRMMPNRFPSIFSDGEDDGNEDGEDRDSEYGNEENETI